MTWSDLRIGLLVAALALAGAFVVSPIIVRETKANQSCRSTIKGLEIAVRSYRTEYLRLLSAKPSGQPRDDATIDTSSPEGIALLAILLGHDKATNPREILFWDAPHPGSVGVEFTPNNGLLDTRSRRGFRMTLDYNSDGLIEDPEGGPAPFKNDVILYSAGRDGDFSTWHDNVCSWK